MATPEPSILILSAVPVPPAADHRLWATVPDGADDLTDLLGDGPSPRVPFDQAGHLKAEVTGPGRSRRGEAVARVLRARPRLEQVDPRGLLATQGGLDREGVRYYLGTGYTRWGMTYADRHSVGNADPVILLRVRDGARLILAGHHRATVALLRGQPLLARVAREEDPAADLSEDGAHHATPLLTFGSDTPLWPCTRHEQTCTAAEAIRGGRAVHVPDPDTATCVLRELGAPGDQAETRVRYALTGRLS